MLRSLPVVLVACLLVGCTPKRPATPPPGVEPQIAEAERLGRLMLTHDVPAARATDEMIRIGVAPSPASGIDGWITVPNADGVMVRFVDDSSNGPIAPYDVTFSPPGVAAVHRNAPSAVLPPDQAAAFRARQLAIDSATLDCADAYNTIVFKDAVGPTDDWYVYLLPATTVPRRVMVGRILRYVVSPDGKKIISSQPLSRDCYYVDLDDAPEGAKVASFFVTNLVTATPNESHVFLSMLFDMPIAVGTRLGAWMVNGGKIRYLAPPKK